MPGLTSARDRLDRFHCLIQHRKDQRLDEGLTDAKSGLMASFASGIAEDHAAVKAALTEPWSYGQTEGQNTKFKLIKRQMYGRANLDLLRACLIGVASLQPTSAPRLRQGSIWALAANLLHRPVTTSLHP